jgi:hypothetical protein
LFFGAAKEAYYPDVVIITYQEDFTLFFVKLQNLATFKLNIYNALKNIFYWHLNCYIILK